MTPPILRASVPACIDAVNRGDTNAFLAFVPNDGVVDDWGRRFLGHDAIRGWSDTEFIGAKGHMSVTKVTQARNEVSVDAGWKRNFYSGHSRFVFVLDGQHIREIRIVDR